MDLLELAAELRTAREELAQANDIWDQLERIYREELARIDKELMELYPYNDDGTVKFRIWQLGQDRARLQAKIWEWERA
jgi:hypothetical protein